MKKKIRKTINITELKAKTQKDQVSNLYREATAAFIQKYPKVLKDSLMFAKVKRIIKEECQTKVRGFAIIN